MRRTGRAVAIGVCAAVALSACAFRDYQLECAGPGDGMTTLECAGVADVVVRTSNASQIGGVMLVSVEHVDCHDLARSSFTIELTEADVERCWTALLEYEGADLHRAVARSRSTGELHVHP